MLLFSGNFGRVPCCPKFLQCPLHIHLLRNSLHFPVTVYLYWSSQINYDIFNYELLESRNCPARRVSQVLIQKTDWHSGTVHGWISEWTYKNQNEFIHMISDLLIMVFYRMRCSSNCISINIYSINKIKIQKIFLNSSRSQKWTRVVIFNFSKKQKNKF